MWNLKDQSRWFNKKKNILNMVQDTSMENQWSAVVVFVVVTAAAAAVVSGWQKNVFRTVLFTIYLTVADNLVSRWRQ